MFNKITNYFDNMNKFIIEMHCITCKYAKLLSSFYRKQAFFLQDSYPYKGIFKEFV